MVTDPSTGKVVTAPEYGGTLTYAWGGRVSDNVDPFAVAWEAGWLIDGVNEKLALGTALSASTMRLTRTMMLEVLRQDYIRTAWAKGLKEQTVVLRHAIKNALIPVVTRSAGLIGRAAAAQPLCGLQFPLVVGGAVFMMNLFNLPGLGRLLVDALSDRDYPVVSGINLFFACIVLLNNLFIDLLYAYLDPRVRYE